MKYRAMISCLLLLSFVGLSFGLSEIAAANTVATVGIGQRPFVHYELSRHNFPLLYGTFLKHGQFAPFMQIAAPAFPIPGLAEGYVPQGMAYSEALGAFVLAAYFPEYVRPSLLALVDAKSGALIKQLHMVHPNGLPYKGHAGGVAAWGDHVWVTSEGRAHRLAVEDLRQANDRGTVQFRDTFRTSNRASISFVDGNTLWVGDFFRVGRAGFDHQLCPQSGNHARMHGFPLSHSEPLGVVGLRRNGESPAPRYALSIPDHAQGIAMATTGEFMLSTSFASRRPSYLWVFPSLHETMAHPPDYHIAVNEHSDIPLWIIDENTALHRQIMPSMSEGITRRGEYIYINFESAALIYRERALLFADHVFRIHQHDLIPDNACELS